MAPLRLPSSCTERRSRRLFILGAPRGLCGFLVAALAFGAGAGCGGDPGDKAELAKLPPPPKELIDRAKGRPLPKTRPKFGSPPRSKDVNP